MDQPYLRCEPWRSRRGTASTVVHTVASLLAVTLAIVALGMTLLAYMPPPQ